MTRALLLLITIVAVLPACSAEQPHAQPAKNNMLQNQQNTKAAEYLVSLDKNVLIDDIISQFSVYGPRVVKDLGRGRYLIQLEQDPGLDVLKQEDCFKKAACKIQPNFKYNSSDNSSLKTH
ncbi:hypothetical protein MNBD_GAMMA21-189 [hydrothermal vent metagenome]|uniref:Uncharacterized protein n=1 Tax=hydrothermal vent metagenome TaxID=652676 RepID=A0A3B1A2U9_9ZZZZ